MYCTTYLFFHTKYIYIHALRSTVYSMQSTAYNYLNCMARTCREVTNLPVNTPIGNATEMDEYVFRSDAT